MKGLGLTSHFRNLALNPAGVSSPPSHADACLDVLDASSLGRKLLPPAGDGGLKAAAMAALRGGGMGPPRFSKYAGVQVRIQAFRHSGGRHEGDLGRSILRQPYLRYTRYSFRSGETPSRCS